MSVEVELNVLMNKNFSSNGDCKMYQLPGVLTLG